MAEGSGLITRAKLLRSAVVDEGLIADGQGPRCETAADLVLERIEPATSKARTVFKSPHPCGLEISEGIDAVAGRALQRALIGSVESTYPLRGG